MMMGLQLLTPVIATVLYVIVFQKAGFRGPILAASAGPIAGAALTFVLFGPLGLYHSGLWLLSVPLHLLPLLILAFKSWPPVAVATNARPET
jgi:hypothetical protein